MTREDCVAEVTCCQSINQSVNLFSKYLEHLNFNSCEGYTDRMMPLPIYGFGCRMLEMLNKNKDEAVPGKNEIFHHNSALTTVTHVRATRTCSMVQSPDAE